MRRSETSVFSMLLIAALASSVSAGEGDFKEKWHGFWSRVNTDFHRMNAFPEPFSTIDRRAYQQPFATQVRQGWNRQNTLGKFYFHPETQELNAAGQRRLFWILTQSPEDFRNVFVVTGMDKDTAEARIASVHTAATELLPGAGVPSVIPTFYEPQGWSAERIDAIDRAWFDSQPQPRLPSS